MEQNDWIIEMERLAEALSDADRDTFPILARRLYMALGDAPGDVTQALGPLCERGRFEGLLDAGAVREAAIELLGDAHYVVSRGAHRFVVASVASDLFPESTISADHESTAFAGALVIGLRDWARAVRHLRSAATR